MCGIIGISSNKSVSSSIINSLKKLEYRGYDSAGIATLSNGFINEVKSEGRVENLENNFDLKDAAFIRDIGFISECCKSIIFRDIGLTHPLEPIVERLMEKTKGSFIQFTKKELFEMLGEDDGKK